MPIINIRFNTQANTKECRPRQIATEAIGMTTNTKAKQTLKYLLNGISSFAHFSVSKFFQDITQLTSQNKLFSAKINNALLLRYYFETDLSKSINKII